MNDNQRAALKNTIMRFVKAAVLGAVLALLLNANYESWVPAKDIPTILETAAAVLGLDGKAFIADLRILLGGSQ